MKIEMNTGELMWKGQVHHNLSMEKYKFIKHYFKKLRIKVSQGLVNFTKDINIIQSYHYEYEISLFFSKHMFILCVQPLIRVTDYTDFT